MLSAVHADLEESNDVAVTVDAADEPLSRGGPGKGAAGPTAGGTYMPPA